MNVEIFENLHKFCLADDLHMVQKLFECRISFQVDLLLFAVKVKDYLKVIELGSPKQLDQGREHKNIPVFEGLLLRFQGRERPSYEDLVPPIFTHGHLIRGPHQFPIFLLHLRFILKPW